MMTNKAQKPTPKREIVVEIEDIRLRITTASQDAKRWIMDEAEAYGQLISEHRRPNCFLLYVDPVWDRKKVAAYLESGGEEYKENYKDEMMPVLQMMVQGATVRVPFSMSVGISNSMFGMLEKDGLIESVAVEQWREYRITQIGRDEVAAYLESGGRESV